MPTPSLTVRSLRARPVVLKLKRPVVARIATLTDWPMILIDLETEEGITGRAYLEPYVTKSMRYLVPALHDMGEMLKGRKLAPVELYEAARKSLHFVGYQGLSMIAVSGLDMAAWDALAKAAGVPLCVLLGGTVGPVKAYNSNGLWLRAPAELAGEATELRDEGGFTGLKLRMGRDRLHEDIAAAEAIRKSVGPRDMHIALQKKACDLVMPDFMRIGGVTGWLRAAAIAGAAGVPMSTHLYPEVAAHVMRVTETAHWLEWQDWADPVLQRPYAIKDSLLQIPDVPGLGLEWDEDAVAKYLVSM